MEKHCRDVYMSIFWQKTSSLFMGNSYPIFIPTFVIISWYILIFSDILCEKNLLSHSGLSPISLAPLT